MGTLNRRTFWYFPVFFWFSTVLGAVNLPDTTTSPRVEASVSAESALIDKETGRIFWEGGSRTTLHASLGPKLSELGIRHLKARFLSALLLWALLGAASGRLRSMSERLTLFQDTEQKLFWVILKHILTWTVLRIPSMNGKMVAVVIFLYLAEAYSCSTRKYLSRSMELDQLQEFIDGLRNTQPHVHWKVRAYHKENLSPSSLLELFRKKSNSTEMVDTIDSSSMFSRKVVTKVAEGTFTFPSYSDDSTAGLWLRAPTESNTDDPPFCKVSLQQRVLFQDGKTREAYLKQQGKFMRENVQGDQFAEYATNAGVHGFQPQVLAVRTGKVRLPMFWLFTLMGLTVTYREWFAGHCDEVHVTLVKQVSSSPPSRSWFTKSAVDSVNQEVFPALMQGLRLYSTKETITTDSTIPDAVANNVTEEIISDERAPPTLDDDDSPTMDQAASGTTEPATETTIQSNEDNEIEASEKPTFTGIDDEETVEPRNESEDGN